MPTAQATPPLLGVEPDSPRKRVLFVDDEVNVLQGLRRLLHPLRQEWDMTFVESGAAALAHLAEAPVDVVVSDMRMPGMDGAQLFEHINQIYPHIVRIVLSGHSDHNMIMRSVKVAHQYLTKPCDAMVLKTTIVRTCALQEILNNTALVNLLAGMGTLPSLPILYQQIMEAVQDSNISMMKVGGIIGQDIGMTAKLLQLVNSAFFSLRRQVTTSAEAVSLLGLETIKTLVLSIQLFNHFDATRLCGLGLDTLWQHSLAVGMCAKGLVKMEGNDHAMAEVAFTGGLLHDVGKLVLATNFPEPYGEVHRLMDEQGWTDWQAEQHIFGATHVDIGTYLLGLWGLPETLVEMLAFHHTPGACLTQHTFSPLTAVAVADVLVNQDAAAEPGEMEHATYLAELGLSDRLVHWRRQYQGPVREEQCL